MAVLDRFVIEHQAQNQWCWAAVAISVFNFFNDQQFASQCALVNKTFSGSLFDEDCCTSGSDDDCDQTFDVSEVLAQFGHLAEESSGSLDFEALTRQIQVNQAPVAIRIQFDDGISDHFVVIIACAVDSQGSQIIQVADPSAGTGNRSTFEFGNFPENYRPGSSWINTYKTQ